MENCSVSVHVPAQRVILLPQEIRKIAQNAAFRVTLKGTCILWLHWWPLSPRENIRSLCLQRDWHFHSIRFFGVYNPSRQVCIYSIPTSGSIRLYYRLGRHDYHTDPEKALKFKEKGDFDSQIILTEDCQKELQWWVDNILSSHNVTTHGQPSHTLITYASQNCWGQFTMAQSLGGFGPMRKNHIT